MYADRKRIASRQNRSCVLLFITAFLVGVFLLVMVSGVVAYMLFQTKPDTSDTLMSTLDPTLTPGISQSRTIDGVTVSLTQASADASLVVIRYDFIGTLYTGKLSASYQPGKLVITVNRLQAAIAEDTAESLALAQERLRKQGIIVEFGRGGQGVGYTIKSVPDGMPEDAVYNAIRVVV